MSQTARSLTALAAELHEQYPDDWMSALANERRLLLIDELRSISTPIEKQHLAKRIAARETGKPPDAISTEVVRKVHISLHHNHLPRLADVGLIDFEVEDGTIHDVRVHIDAPLLNA